MTLTGDTKFDHCLALAVLRQPVSMATNSIILLLVLSISCLCSTSDVYIQPSEGEHCPGPCYNISTFGKMADSYSNSFGLVVHFLEGTHLLDQKKPMVFTSLTNAVFEGDGRMEQGFYETVWQSTVVIKCTEHSSTGIAFVNSSNITFRYITITNCGADMRKLFHHDGPTSLGYVYVTNIFIDHVSVQNGSGSGLLVMTNVTDLTIVNNSSFAQNHGKYNVFISHIDPENCTFALQKHVHKTLICNTNISFGNGNGGGLAIVMFQGSYSVAVVLDNVTAYGNRGSYGNILISAIEHKVPTYNLTINNTVSSNAQGTTALWISSLFGTDQHKHRCHTNTDFMINLIINIDNSKFTNNNSSSNGSVVIGFDGIKFLSTVTIKSTEMLHNIGSGLQLYLSSHHHQRQLLVTLINVIVSNNSCPSNSIIIKSTLGAKNIDRLELNNVRISNNNMTGLSAYNTAITVKGTSVFHNNTGTDGGGLAMYGGSYLMFDEHSFLNFTNNGAQKGGAIFVETQLQNSFCFFQYSDHIKPQSKVAAFFGNKADIAGTVLYGGDIINCDLFFYDKSTNWFNRTFDYYSAQTGPSVISSEPTDVCFCGNNNTINCSQTQLTVTAYPGEKINISVVTVGQLNGVAPGILQIQPVENADPSTNTNLYNTSAMNCTKIAFTPVEKAYMINLKSFKLLNISFSDCPLGFQSLNLNKSCDCEEKVKNLTTTVTCDAKTKMITRQGDIWIGNISDHCVVVYTPCPFDYCNTAQVSFSPTDPDPQCALNRTGILCGRCQDGLSLALGSNNCIQCPGFSYLALIIPFAAAGFGLVALLMVLNLTVSIGTINGLIFYASIVKVSESTGIFFPNGPIPVLSQFIAWLNLDLGIETCFYHGMTAYAKVWLQFVFPLYIWFIIATIIVLCRYSTWLSNKIGGNVVQVLATLILLSFTKIFRTFTPALSWINLSLMNNSITTKWYVDGNVDYFSPEHYILMAAAVLFLLLAVPYTFVLLFDAVIEKYLTRIGFFRKQWIKFKPFVDAYHGPYKDNCRFWTGLLLLVRMSFTLASLHLDTFGTLIFITASTTVLFSLMVTFEGIYQKKYLNILECLSYLNLGLLSALAAVYQDDVNNEQVVTIISASIALVMFIGILFFHLFLRICRFCRYKNGESSDKRLDQSMIIQLVEPTSSEVCVKRESLLYNNI